METNPAHYCPLENPTFPVSTRGADKFISNGYASKAKLTSNLTGIRRNRLQRRNLSARGLKNPSLSGVLPPLRTELPENRVYRVESEPEVFRTDCQWGA